MGKHTKSKDRPKSETEESQDRSEKQRLKDKKKKSENASMGGFDMFASMDTNGDKKHKNGPERILQRKLKFLSNQKKCTNLQANNLEWTRPVTTSILSAMDLLRLWITKSLSCPLLPLSILHRSAADPLLSPTYLPT